MLPREHFKICTSEMLFPAFSAMDSCNNFAKEHLLSFILNKGKSQNEL